MTNGEEFNPSNTNKMGTTCVDGNSGSYHGDESIDQITVTAGDIVDGTDVPSGGFIVEGGRAYVSVKVWCWGSGASDTADIYITNDASAPDWNHLVSIGCPGGGEQMLKHAFDVGQGTTQSIRVNFRYNGAQSTCSSGSYDDHDDIIFTVKEGLPTPAPVPTPPPTQSPESDSLGGPQEATYDGTLFTAPKCSHGSSCDSGSLLNGRANIGGGGAEPNQPNSLNSCTDGSDGSYHGDESCDRIVVSRASGGDGYMTEGEVVTITATVWCWSTGTSDYIDFYYASDASNPAWIQIGQRQQCPGGGERTVTASYTLPQGTTQAVRVNMMYGSNSASAASCVSGSYDDVDDLVISVKPNSAQGIPAAAAVPIKNDPAQGILNDDWKDVEADELKKKLKEMNESNTKPNEEEEEGSDDKEDGGKKKGKGKRKGKKGDDVEGPVNEAEARAGGTSKVNKFICAEERPLDVTICGGGSPADDTCSSAGDSCGGGKKRKKCHLAECSTGKVEESS